MKKLIISFVSIMLMAILSFVLFVFLWQGTNRALNWGALLGVGTLLFLLGSTLFATLAYRYRNQLLAIIRGMNTILSSTATRVQMLRPMIVESNDEIGQVGIAFNELQEHFTKEYQEIDKEITLAYQIQQKLLPTPEQHMGQVEIQSFCQPIKEVGGDLYDVIPLNEQRFAVAIGDVSGKGLPAALLMSAIIFLLRTEMAQGGTPGDILTRLNRQVFETMAGEMYVTLALAIIDQQHWTLEYASAGHVAPYIVRQQKLEQILTSTLPLGITADEQYAEQRFSMLPADRFFLYTDGIVDTFISEDEMLGFERLEQYLLDLNPERPLTGQMSELMEKVSIHGIAKHEDDRTAIFIRWSESKED